MRRSGVVIVVALSLMFSPARAQVISARAGEVARAEGEVWWHSRDVAEMMPLRPGARLSAGDVVRTGEDGRAEWSLNPGSSFQVAPRSRVRIHDTALDRMRFEVEHGEVFVIVAALERGVALSLGAPPALLIVASRGRYRIRVGEDGSTEAAVGQGELRFVDGVGRVVRVTRRRRVRFTGAVGVP